MQLWWSSPSLPSPSLLIKVSCDCHMTMSTPHLFILHVLQLPVELFASLFQLLLRLHQLTNLHFTQALNTLALDNGQWQHWSATHAQPSHSATFSLSSVATAERGTANAHAHTHMHTCHTHTHPRKHACTHTPCTHVDTTHYWRTTC